MDYILTHTTNAKCYSNVILIDIRDLAEIIASFMGYGRHSPHPVMIKRERLTDSFSQISVFISDKIALQWMKQYM